MKARELCAAVDAGQPVFVPEPFAAAVRSAAQEARGRREIGLIQHWRINAATRNHRRLAKIYAGVIDESVQAGILDADADVYGIDWENVLAFIRELLPLILQIISIFS
jgi:hypothetical protein